MTENEKTTALIPSVGADGGQSPRNSTKSSITENTSQNKHQNVNPQNNLPSEIVQKGRFCCWRYEERDGRKTKVPYNPLTGQMLGATMPVVSQISRSHPARQVTQIHRYACLEGALTWLKEIW